MGTGIVAVIPIIMGPQRSGWEKIVDKRYFLPAFFEYYDVSEDGNIYTIKYETLLNNFKSFLTEFYDLIGEDCSISGIEQVSNYEEFSEIFSSNRRNS